LKTYLYLFREVDAMDKREEIMEKRSSLRSWRERAPRKPRQGELLGIALVAVIFLAVAASAFMGSEDNASKSGESPQKETPSPATASTQEKTSTSKTAPAITASIPAPSIKLNSPENRSYNISAPELDLLVVGAGLDSVLFSIDGKENITIPHDGAIAKIELTGLKAGYSFDENANNTAYDASGNGNHGRISGAKWATGKFNSALSFDGSSYVEIPDSQAFNLKSWTITGWVYINELSTKWNQIIVKQIRYPAERQWVVYINQETGGMGGSQTIGSSAVDLGFGSAPIKTWYFFSTTGEYDASTDTTTVKTYLNGELKGSKSAKGSLYYANVPLKIGSTFDGKIDNVLIFDRALSPSEIALLSSYSYPLSDGNHNLTIFANNTADNASSMTISFTINATTEKAKGERIGGMGETLRKGGFEVTLKNFEIYKEIKVYPTALKRSQYVDAKSQSMITLQVKNVDDKEKPFKLNPPSVLFDDQSKQYQMRVYKFINIDDQIEQITIYPGVTREGVILFDPVSLTAKELTLYLYINGEKYEFAFKPFT
jgi:hypothetical protein